MTRVQCQHCGIIADTEKTSDEEWDDIAETHRHGIYAWVRLKKK